MKLTKYRVTAGLFCLLAGFALIHFANHSGTAEDVKKGQVSNSDATANVGTVVMWWGSRDAVPVGWEICDGTAAKTAGAVLSGNKPNLVDRFPKGALASRTTVANLKDGTGGNNNQPALRIGKIQGLKVDEDGAHSHAPLKSTPTVSSKSSSGSKSSAADDSNSSKIVLARATDDAKETAADRDDDDDKAEGAHSHKLSGFVGSENGVNADGDDQTGANQPAYSELFFIIRVK